jgi:hypothetical protein
LSIEVQNSAIVHLAGTDPDLPSTSVANRFPRARFDESRLSRGGNARTSREGARGDSEKHHHGNAFNYASSLATFAPPRRRHEFRIWRVSPCHYVPELNDSSFDCEHLGLLLKRCPPDHPHERSTP